MAMDREQSSSEEFERDKVFAAVASVLGLWWFSCSLSIFFPELFRWVPLRPNLYGAMIASPLPALGAVWLGFKAYRRGYKVGVAAVIIGAFVLIGMILLLLTGNFPSASEYEYGTYR